MSFPTELTNAVDSVTEIVAAHLNNLEAKVGIDNSAVATSLDYLLKNTSCINPGHKHSKLWASDGSQLAVTVDASGNVGIGTENPAQLLDIAGKMTLSGAIVGGHPNFLDIYLDTADGSDTKGLRFGGGGDVINSRGAWCSFFGNENATWPGVLRLDAGNVSDGHIYLRTQNTDRLVILYDGNIGVGKANPSYLLDMEASGGGYYSTSDHSWHNGSSIRWKEAVKPIENPLAVLLKLRGITFKWKDSGLPGMSLIAEEVGKEVPEAVSFSKETPEFCDGFNPGALIGLLVEAVKAQQTQIEALQAKFN